MNDGGTAFPTTQYYDEKPIGCNEGMTLRDYFATHAMQAILATSAPIGEQGDFAERVCTAAYIMADQMLQQREKK